MFGAAGSGLFGETPIVGEGVVQADIGDRVQKMLDESPETIPSPIEPKHHTQM